ncbi:MAG TPA: amidase [Acidimicrobiales bacterium]|nr:amidase [Acidimicrobiales bacterium]
MGTFVLRLDEGRGPLRVAVKDVVDLAGTPTTAGCRMVALAAAPADADAACLAGLRAAVADGAASIVGKTGCNELAFGVTGLNPFFGSPVNPLDPTRVVGGSSSGSAAAVAAGDADVAVGSDTGGSIRIPAACCGVAGLKTTAGRVPLAGVWPLAPSLDTVGPLARDVAGLVAGMALLEPGFTMGGAVAAAAVGRVRLPAAPAVDAAIDAALAAAGLATVEVALPGWAAAHEAATTVLLAEAWATDRHLWDTGGLSPEVADRLALGAAIGAADLAAARAGAGAWVAEVTAALAALGGPTPAVLAMPTLAEAVPRVADAATVTTIRHTLPWNLAGWPALSLPVPVAGGGVPASLQLVAAPGGEELLLATAAIVEAAVGA